MAIFYTDSGSFNSVQVTGSANISASSGIALQVRSSGSTVFSVSGSSGEIFNISDINNNNLFSVSSGSVGIFSIDNTKTVRISGSLIVTGSITGSLLGTASFASTSSFVNPLTQSVSISGSLDVNGTGIYRDVLTIQKTGNTPGILLQESSAGGFYAPIIQFRTLNASNQVQISSIRGEYQGSAPQTLLLSAPTFGYVAFGGSGQPGEYPVSINTYPYGVNAAPNNFVQRISTTENSAVGLIIKNQTIQSPNPTGNFLEFRNANNTVLSAVTSGGSFLIGTSTTSSLKLDVSGSTRIQGDTTITGSFTVFTGSAVEFQVTNTGVKIGNAITDAHTVTGSLNISGSVNATSFTGSLQGTASFAISSSIAVSSSFATTASYSETSALTNNVYFAQGALNGNQGIPDSANTIIQFVDQFDPQGWWDSGTYRFIPNIAGYYIVSLGATLENTSNNTGYVQIQILKTSGTSSFTEMSCKQPLNNTSDSSLFGSKIIYLDGNTDYLEFAIYQSSGGTFNILEGPGGQSPDTWFSATYMTM